MSDLSRAWEDRFEKARQREIKLLDALREANDALRGLYQVVERKGVDTNWNGCRKWLKKLLAEEHKILSP